jgi:hypothetical protein
MQGIDGIGFDKLVADATKQNAPDWVINAINGKEFEKWDIFDPADERYIRENAKGFEDCIFVFTTQMAFHNYKCVAIVSTSQANMNAFGMLIFPDVWSVN